MTKELKMVFIIIIIIIIICVLNDFHFHYIFNIIQLSNSVTNKGHNKKMMSAAVSYVANTNNF